MNFIEVLRRTRIKWSGELSAFLTRNVCEIEGNARHVPHDPGIMPRAHLKCLSWSELLFVTS